MADRWEDGIESWKDHFHVCTSVLAKTLFVNTCSQLSLLRACAPQAYYTTSTTTASRFRRPIRLKTKKESSSSPCRSLQPTKKEQKLGVSSDRVHPVVQTLQICRQILFTRRSHQSKVHYFSKPSSNPFQLIHVLPLLFTHTKKAYRPSFRDPVSRRPILRRWRHDTFTTPFRNTLTMNLPRSPVFGGMQSRCACR